MSLPVTVQGGGIWLIGSTPDTQEQAMWVHVFLFALDCGFALASCSSSCLDFSHRGRL